MIKARRKILFSLIIVITSFFSIIKVNANTINRIDMDIVIHSNGDASVTEIWDAYLDQGTEGYKPYANLGNANITNFSVSDDSGAVYDSLSEWDTSLSFNNKAYKCGIHNTANGVELCWGISNYGKRIYTLKYDLSNFVSQYTDAQGIYFNFLNLDQSIGKAKITIHSDVSFSLENSKIWGFGYFGKDVFENGTIIFESDGHLSSNQYIVGLIRFESNLFNTNNRIDSSFDDIYNSAFNDVKDLSNDTYEPHYSFGSILLILIALIFNPVFWIFGFMVLYRLKGKTWLLGSGKSSNELNFGIEGKILPPENQIDYWREIPCDKDLEKAYWVCLQYNVVFENKLREGIIGAILLKWIKNGFITVSETKKGLFSFKDNNYAIDFSNMTHAENEIENNLFTMLISACGSNKILEAKEFEKWSKKNYSKILSWFSFICDKEQSYLEAQGLITSTSEETDGMFGRKKTIIVKNVNPQLREEALHLTGLKKFLLDFSVIAEREYFEVHVWEEYLIFAQLLGIADKVEEQFNKLYPNFNQLSKLNTDITTITVRNMATICYKGVQEGIARSSSGNDYSGSSRSSGSGGSSYSSGGSSSGGSSGGGFR